MRHPVIPLLLVVTVSLPLSDPPMAAEPTERATVTTRVDPQDIPLEELAHAFFAMQSAPAVLAQRISALGVERLKPELAAHNQWMMDVTRIAAMQRELCWGLQRARTGAEFAALLAQSHEREAAEMRHAARRILEVLDSQDRQKLESYLDGEFRSGAVKSTVDWEALFAIPGEAFPNTRAVDITRQVCDTATRAEAQAGVNQQ